MSGIFHGLGDADTPVGTPLSAFNANISAIWDQLLVARERVAAHAKPAYDEDMVQLNSLAAQVRAGGPGEAPRLLAAVAKLAQRFVNAAKRAGASNVGALSDIAKTLAALASQPALSGLGAGVSTADFSDEPITIEVQRPASGGGLFKAVAIFGLVLLATRRGRK